MVEIMIPLSYCDKRGEDMITGRVLIVKWSITQPVRKGIDAESALDNAVCQSSGT